MAKRHYPAHHDHIDEEKLTVSEPEDHAAGVKAVAVSMGRALHHMGLVRTARTLLKRNQTDGFDCISCAWPHPDPEHRHKAEFCENGGVRLPVVRPRLRHEQPARLLHRCREWTSVALAESIGKASVTLSDIYNAELIIPTGQNPGTNHPRMLSAPVLVRTRLAPPPRRTYPTHRLTPGAILRMGAGS